MNVEHQVLQVRIYTCLRVDRCLLIGQQMVELDYTDGNSLEFLCFKHDLFKLRIFYNLIGNDCGEMSSFCDVPPIITVKRGVQIVSQTLHAAHHKKANESKRHCRAAENRKGVRYGGCLERAYLPRVSGIVSVLRGQRPQDSP